MVDQLRVLLMHKCLNIVARVVGVSVRVNEVRVVVLVDVYLPIALWSGWQFPKSGPIAAAFFKHLRFVISIRLHLFPAEFSIPIIMFLFSIGAGISLLVFDLLALYFFQKALFSR